MNPSRTTTLRAITTALALLSTAAMADKQIVDGIEWTYTVSKDTASVGGGYGSPAVPTNTTDAIVIPSTLGGHPVTSIRDYAFRDCSGLTSVTIPDSVTSIGRWAFRNCSGLTRVTIPDRVTGIQDSAFGNCSNLTSVTIGNSVTNIGQYAFSRCSSLTSVTIPDSVKSIEYSAFSRCSGLTSVTIPNSVTIIGSAAFEHCRGLTSVTIPDSVTGIESWAFYGCRCLTSVTIGNNVTNIGGSALSDCSSLTSVIIPDSVTSIGDSAFEGCTNLMSVTIGNSVTNIGDSAFAYCSNLASVTIPDSVASIEDDAFSGCSRLKMLYVPAAWEGTDILTGACLPNDCTVVYREAPEPALALAESHRTFAADAANGQLLRVRANVSWTAVSSVSWLTVATASGSGIGNIEYALSANSESSSRTGTITVSGGGMTQTFTVTQSGKIATLTLKADSRTFPADATSGELLVVTANVSWTASSSASWLTVHTANGSGSGDIEYAVAANTGVGSRTGTITVSGGGLMRTFTVTQSGKPVVPGAATQTIAGIEWVYTISGGTASIGTGYYHVPAIPSDTIGAIIIPSTLGGYPVTGIGYSAFYSCSGLTSVTIPHSVTSIEDDAFSGCSGLTSLAIPDSVTSIGSDAFFGCNALYDTNTIPGVCLVDGWAVGWTNSLSGALDLTGVRDIADGAFSGCSGLTSVTIPDSVTSIGDDVFEGCNGLASVTIPDSVTEIGAYAFRDCIGMKSVHFGNSVMYISGYAFLDCTNLTSLVFPDSVTEIGRAAFIGCSELRSVKIPDSVKRIGYAVFAHCSDELYDDKSIPGVRLVDGWAVGANDSLPAILELSGIRGIAEWGFEECSDLASVTLGKSVTSIGNAAFADCGALTNIVVSTENPSYASKDGVVFSKNGKALVLCPGGKTGVYSIPNGVEDIADYAFCCCRGLTSVAIPGSVTNIGYEAFVGCSSLSSLTIPDSVASIGVYAFENCRGLTSVTIGNGVTNALDYAFEGCSSLRTLCVPASWQGTSMLDEARIPEGCKVVYGAVPESVLALSEDNRNFTADAASGQTLAVTANVAWMAASSASWLTVAASSGSGNGSIEYAVIANPESSSRTGTITVTGGGLTRTFTVTQSGVAATLELGTNSRTFMPDAASGMELPITANVAWTAVSSASWLTVKNPNGTGNGVVAYDVEANPGTAERMAAITVTGGGLTRIFLATQGGQTETQGTPVGVPCQWLEKNAADILAAHGGNYEMAALALATNGLPVWQCYVAGLSTTDKEVKFKVKSISFENGAPMVKWDPDLDEVRAYTVQGKPTMTNAWGVTNASSRFFRVLVEMP